MCVFLTNHIIHLKIITAFVFISHRSPNKSMSSDHKDHGHIYDELSLFTLAVKNATPSPKSDKVVFDTSCVQPCYQPLPKPRYESMEKCNNYHIEKDDVSIKDEDCHLTKPHYECCSASSTEKCNDYHIERDIRSTEEEDGHFPFPQYKICSASSTENDYHTGEDIRSATKDEGYQKMIDKVKTEHEPYSKLVHRK